MVPGFLPDTITVDIAGHPAQQRPGASRFSNHSGRQLSIKCDALRSVFERLRPADGTSPWWDEQAEIETPENAVLEHAPSGAMAEEHTNSLCAYHKDRIPLVNSKGGPEETHIHRLAGVN